MRRHLHTALICTVAVTLAAGGLARAQENGEPEAERILVDKVPDYWIGVHAVPVHDALKSHLQLEDRLIVARIVPDSPAAKAGLQQHDILLKFGDAKISSHRELIAAVEAAKANETAVTVLRGGTEKTISVTPTKRPDDIVDLPIPERALRSFDDVLRGADRRWRGRFLGPGFFLDRTVEDLPEGVSIAIKKENDEPAKITVKRGEDRWEVTEDSIGELPEDLQKHVQRQLKKDEGRSFVLEPDGAIHIDPRRFVPEAVQPRVNEALRRFEQFQRRFEKDDPFKALQEQVEALRHEVEKLRQQQEKAQDKAKPDEARDA